MDSVTSARGPLMPNPRLMLMPLLMLTTDTTAVDTVMDTDTVDTMAMAVMDSDMVLDTTDTVTSARGPLMPNPRLMLMPLLMLTTDTTAVDTVMDTDTVSDMAVTTDMVDTLMLMVDTVTSARGPLMPSPRLMLMPLLMLTTDTTAMDTVMAVTMVDTTDIPMPVDTDTVVTDTMVRLSNS